MADVTDIDSPTVLERNGVETSYGLHHGVHVEEVARALLALEARIAEVERERDGTREHSKDLLRACDEYVAQANRSESRTLAATARLASIEKALDSARSCMAGDPRDWSMLSRDAWLYGLFCGWGDALDHVAEKHGWKPEDVERLLTLAPDGERGEG